MDDMEQDDATFDMDHEDAMNKVAQATVEETIEDQDFSAIPKYKLTKSFYGEKSKIPQKKQTKHAAERTGKKRKHTKPKKGSKKANVNEDSKWRELTEDFQNPNKDVPFVEYVGLGRKAAAAKSPIEFFLLFFTTEIFQTIAEQTNLYYQQCSLLKDSPMSWKQVSTAELMAFFATQISMGIANLPEIDDYWNEKGIFHMPWFAAILSRGRFKQILRYLHLADNTKAVP